MAKDLKKCDVVDAQYGSYSYYGVGFPRKTEDGHKPLFKGNSRLLNALQVKGKKVVDGPTFEAYVLGLINADLGTQMTQEYACGHRTWITPEQRAVMRITIDNVPYDPAPTQKAMDRELGALKTETIVEAPKMISMDALQPITMVAPAVMETPTQVVAPAQMPEIVKTDTTPAVAAADIDLVKRAYDSPKLNGMTYDQKRDTIVKALVKRVGTPQKAVALWNAAKISKPQEPMALDLDF